MSQIREARSSFTFIITLIFGVIYFFSSIQSTYASDTFHHTRDGYHTCNFFDTINITGATQFPNGSYLHDDILIPPSLIGLYDYVYKDLISRVDVQPHYRACICKLKPCINFCCPWGMHYNMTLNGCEAGKDDYKWPQQHLNVTFNDGTQKTVNLTDQFIVQHFRPCEHMYALMPELQEYDNYYVFENGTLHITEYNELIHKAQYCLMPTIANETDEYYVIHPANCIVENEYTTVKIVNAYAMLFSIPFMILTIVVYLSIPELRNQHGKSLVCYLLGLIIGYSMLSCIALSSYESISYLGCEIIGFVAYYFFMAAFFWLSVISFDLWHNFRGTRGANRFQEKKRFLIYSLYAWGLAAIFLIFTWYAQTQTDWPNNFKPGIGGEFFCWLDMRSWSAMIYFFGPILIIILVNTVMFLMTALKIHKVQREMARIMAREDSTKNLRTEKDKFGLFLRLFIVMGVTWSLEILSYFVGSDKFWSKIFYASDICNAIQGFLIFVLFVMKKKVKHLITNRLLKRKPSNQSASTNSTTSECTHNSGKNSIQMKPQNGLKNDVRF